MSEECVLLQGLSFCWGDNYRDGREWGLRYWDFTTRDNSACRRVLGCRSPALQVLFLASECHIKAKCLMKTLWVFYFPRLALQAAPRAWACVVVPVGGCTLHTECGF